MVATEIENESLIEVFAEYGYGLVDEKFSATNAYHMFSPIAGTRVALVRCSMGGGGPGGPELTVAEAISALKPTSVIMAGIAFGISDSDARIGDVLISSQVFDYELVRIGTGSGGSVASLSRGARPEASPRLMSRFRMARLPSYGLRVREGIILSGKEAGRQRRLPGFAEGDVRRGDRRRDGRTGVYDAAERLKVELDSGRSICNWADG